MSLRIYFHIEDTTAHASTGGEVSRLDNVALGEHAQISYQGKTHGLGELTRQLIQFPQHSRAHGPA